MYKYILDSIDQIDWLAIIPLIIFFTFFVGTIIQVVREKKSFIEKMEKMPLEEDWLVQVNENGSRIPD